MWSLDGPYFVRFASRLIYYSGAVQGKLKADYSEHNEDGTVTLRKVDSNVESTSKVKMSDAMKNYQSDDLDALNYESQITGGDTLFERVTVPGN